jgi:hypothetical protein
MKAPALVRDDRQTTAAEDANLVDGVVDVGAVRRSPSSGVRLSLRSPGDLDDALAAARFFGTSSKSREVLLRAALAVLDVAATTLQARRPGLPPVALRIPSERIGDMLRVPVLEDENRDALAESRYLVAVVALALAVSDAVSGT